MSNISFPKPTFFVPLAPLANPAAPLEEDDDLAQRFQAAKDGHPLAWELPKGLQVAQAAQRCLELVDDYPAEVTTLLAHPNGVASEAIALLPSLKSVPEQGKQFLQAILNACHRVDESPAFHDSMNTLIRERRQKSDDYRREKHEAYQHAIGNGSLKAGWPYERDEKNWHPFLSINPDYPDAIVDNNGKLFFNEEPLWCRHLQYAVQNTADVKKLAKGDVSWITPEVFATGDESKEEGSHLVAFSREKFGEILAVLMQLVKPGQEESFEMGWWIAEEKDHFGHILKLTIKIDSKGLPKIYNYNSKVTGDRMHTRSLPEDVRDFHYDDFNYTQEAAERGAHVLQMNVKDPELAKALAGRFVKADTKHQQLAFINALCDGNIAGMKAALEALGEHPWDSMEAHLKKAFSITCDFQPHMVSEVLSALKDAGPSCFPPSFFKYALITSLQRANRDGVTASLEAVLGKKCPWSDDDLVKLGNAILHANKRNPDLASQVLSALANADDTSFSAPRFFRHVLTVALSLGNLDGAKALLNAAPDMKYQWGVPGQKKLQDAFFQSHARYPAQASGAWSALTESELSRLPPHFFRDEDIAHRPGAGQAMDRGHS